MQQEQSSDQSLITLHNQVEEKRELIRQLENEITQSKREIEELRKKNEAEENVHESLQDQIRTLDS